jgi:hypothetical protein
MGPAIGGTANLGSTGGCGLRYVARRAWLAWILFATVSANVVAAPRQPKQRSSPSLDVHAWQSAGPRVSGALHEQTNLKLGAAHLLAVSRLRELPGCRALFEQLGADGLEKLANSIYYTTTPRQEEGACRQGAVALTMVGSPQTRLCRAFGQLGGGWAAMILIHEALHFAGMGEKPLDPAGLTSPEINWLVKARCKL